MAGDKKQGGNSSRLLSNPSQRSGGAMQEKGSRERDRHKDWVLLQGSGTSAGTVHFSSTPCFTEFLLQCPLGWKQMLLLTSLLPFFGIHSPFCTAGWEPVKSHLIFPVCVQVGKTPAREAKRRREYCMSMLCLYLLILPDCKSPGDEFVPTP